MPDSTELDFLPYNASFLIASGLSAIASAIMLVILLKRRFYKEPLGLMNIGINLTDLIYCFTKLFATLNHPTSHIGCNIIEAITHFGFTSAAIWGALFGHALTKVVSNQTVEVLRTYTRSYCLVATVPPFIISIILVLTDYVRYSDSNQTCVHLVMSGTIDIDYTIFTTLPLVLACILSVVWYIRVARNLRHFVSRQNIKNLYLLMIYPAIVIVCWFPTLTKNALLSMGIISPSNVVRIVSIFTQLQGLLDAIVYGSQSIKLSCCKKRRSTMDCRLDQSDLYLSVLNDSSIRDSLGRSQKVQIDFSGATESVHS